MKKYTHGDIKKLLSGYFYLKKSNSAEDSSSLAQPKGQVYSSELPLDVQDLALNNNAYLESYTNFHKTKKMNEISDFKIFSRLNKLKSTNN
ncbi:hypothetical protein [Succinivibrio dextrinosolvens]|uniref:hypothetical protein n=1 Tax=Succinivibrio dextrinosolvens TaxID=83771 RepID=UPI002478E60F|nr:hypothetical protein [Succinivibrio dextrinosolvens]